MCWYRGPPARDALYHRFDNELFDQLLERLSGTDGESDSVAAQRFAAETYRRKSERQLIVPEHALDGANLIAQ